jgi:hypothetical protein
MGLFFVDLFRFLQETQKVFVFKEEEILIMDVSVCPSHMYIGFKRVRINNSKLPSFIFLSADTRSHHCILLKTHITNHNNTKDGGDRSIVIIQYRVRKKPLSLFAKKCKSSINFVGNNCLQLRKL